MQGCCSAFHKRQLKVLLPQANKINEEISSHPRLPKGTGMQQEEKSSPSSSREGEGKSVLSIF
jgi:hypothetical protein